MPNWKKLIVSGSDAALNSLNVTSALTASGLIYPTTDGDNGDFLTTDGIGNLSFGRPNVYANVKNVSGVQLLKGTPVHATGTAGNASEVIAASASVASTMPATFILNETLADDAEGLAILTGYINGVNTSAFGEGDVVYVGPTGSFTNIKPQGSDNLIQNLGIVTKIDATNGSGYVYGSGRSNDVPNLPEGNIWVGSSTYTVTSSVAHLDETNERLGINTNTPGASLDVIGDISGSTKITIGSDHTNTGTLSSIAGGTLNTASAACTFIGGGCENYIDANSSYGIIVGGRLNVVKDNYAVIVGGALNCNGTYSCCSFIGAGYNNYANGTYGFIGAGQGNKITTYIPTSYGSFIGAGYRNRVCADGTTAAVVAGAYNTASGESSFIGAGFENHINGWYSFIGSGGCLFTDGNFLGGSNSFIGSGNAHCVKGSGLCNNFIGAGGCNHICSAKYVSIVGGTSNSSSADYTFIGGGGLNVVSGCSSVIGGGQSNCITSALSFIGGGCNNSATANCSTIAGGVQNTTAGTFGSTVGGGYNNYSGNWYTVIAGGHDNCATSCGASVGGGGYNYACGADSVIAGGCKNLATGTNSAIVGGTLNTGSGAFGFIGGGCLNNIELGNHTLIAGGRGNHISGSNCGVIVGGVLNILSSVSGLYGPEYSSQSLIGSGQCNKINGVTNSSIVGGANNYINSATSFIGGGAFNSGSGLNSVIGGGHLNCAKGNCSFVGAGRENDADCAFSAIVAGCSNSICFHCSAIVAGERNTICGRSGFIGAGSVNTIENGNNYNSIINGLENLISGSYDPSVAQYPYANLIGGGRYNTGSSSFGVIGGGCRNVINNTATGSAILGGRSNTVNHHDSFIIGSNLTSDKACYTFMNNLDVAGTVSGSTFSGSFVGDGSGLTNISAGSVGAAGSNTQIQFNNSGVLGASGDLTWDGTTLDTNGNLDVAGTVRLGYTGTDPVIFGNPAGKRTEWNNPGYFEIYAEDTDSPGTFRETIDIDGDYGGGGFIGVYPSNTTNRSGVHMWSAPDQGRNQFVVNSFPPTGVNRDSEIEASYISGSSAHPANINYTGSFITVSSSYDNKITIGTCVTDANVGSNNLYVVGDVAGTTKITIGSNHCNTGTLSSIAGGTLNTSSQACSFIGGGQNNKITSYSGTFSISHSNILGGCNNCITLSSGYGGKGNSILGGESNTISSPYGSNTIVGGRYNSISNIYDSFIGSGYNNCVTGAQSVIVGGGSNTVTGTKSSTLSGYYNCVTGNGSIIGGGSRNTVSGQYAGTFSGCYNTVSGNYAGTLSGCYNTVSGNCGIIGGGARNTVSGCFSVVGGGNCNTAGGIGSSVLGGVSNSALGNCSVVVGGTNNLASGLFSYAGGEGSLANAAQSFAHGYFVTASGGAAAAFGALTQADGYNAFAVGTQNLASNTDSVAFGYQTCAVASQSMATGYQTCAAGASSLAGGGESCAIGGNSIAWGTGNCACGFNSVVLGCFNTARNNQSFVTGISNCIGTGAGTTNTIFGASNCINTGQNNFLVGGTGLVSVGSYNFIGGQCNSVLNDIDTSGFATIFGCRNCANGRGSVSFTHGKFNNNFSFAGVALGQGSSAARGDQQFVFGCCVTNPNNGTTANIANSMVIGRYNVWNTTNCHLFAVGNGGSDISRTNAFNVSSNGRVGVCCIAPQSALDVNGTTRTTTLVETSARRYKENIISLQDQLDNLKKLEPVEFEWKETKKKDIGLIAEDVEKIYPHLVEHDDNGDLMGVKYSKLTSVLIKAVQEQQEQIDKLKAEVKLLKQNK